MEILVLHTDGTFNVFRLRLKLDGFRPGTRFFETRCPDFQDFIQFQAYGFPSYFMDGVFEEFQVRPKLPDCTCEPGTHGGHASQGVCPRDIAESESHHCPRCQGIGCVKCASLWRGPESEPQTEAQWRAEMEAKKTSRAEVEVEKDLQDDIQREARSE